MNNPFIEPQSTYLDYPDFSLIKFEHFRPAFEEGIKQQLIEIEEISNNPKEPSFENTLVQLEKSGKVLNRVMAVFYALASADTNEEIMTLEEEFAPILSAHNDKIYLNKKLFTRIKYIYDSSNLENEDLKLLHFYYDKFVQLGALLNDQEKEELTEINKEETQLIASFGNKLTKATNTPFFFKDKEILVGLSDEDLISAKNLAEKEGHLNEYAFSLENTTQQSLLSKLRNRDTRKYIFELSINRCLKNDQFDTQSIAKRLAFLRAKKAKILGFQNFAEWKLQDQLAATPENVDKFLKDLVDLAIPFAEKTKKELTDFARKTEDNNFQLEAWDWPFFAEEFRKSEYNINETSLKEYFELNSVLIKGVFYAANKLYGIMFRPKTDIPVYHKDVQVWDVINEEGTPFALFYFDPFSRPSKSGGAWMSNFVEQSFILNKQPIIYNVCNFKKGEEGMPSLLSWDEVTTLFHEFGHALHGLFAQQKYPSLSGTNVPRDFVEMPSQFNEHCALDPSVFENYAIHYKTKEKMPKEMIEKMKNSQKCNQAYSLLENISACILDQAWHKLTEDNALIDDIQRFEKDVLEQFGLLKTAIPPRYSTSYFRHIWCHGYSSGYYAYLWSEALDNNVLHYFLTKGGFSRKNGERLKKMILSKGNSEELMPLFYKFCETKNVDIKPLLEARGLI